MKCHPRQNQCFSQLMVQGGASVPSAMRATNIRLATILAKKSLRNGNMRLDITSGSMTAEDFMLESGRRATEPNNPSDG